MAHSHRQSFKKQLLCLATLVLACLMGSSYWTGPSAASNDIETSFNSVTGANKVGTKHKLLAKDTPTNVMTGMDNSVRTPAALNSLINHGKIANDWVRATVMQPDSKVTIGGNFTPSNHADEALYTSGTLDESGYLGSSVSYALHGMTPTPVTPIYVDNITVFSASAPGCCPCFCPGALMSPSPVTYHFPRDFFITGLTVDNDDFSGNNHSGFGNIKASISDINGNVIATSTNTLYGESGRHDFTFVFETQLIPQDFKLSLFLTDGIQAAGSFRVYNLRFFEDITPVLTQLSQLKANTGTVIPEGAQTIENPVALGGTVKGFPYQVKLQVELQLSSQAFTNIPNIESQFVPSGTFVSVTPSTLSDGQYHWQGRTIDSQGNTSQWQEFGATGNVDFVIKTTPTFPQVYADTITVFSATNASGGGCCPNYVMPPSPVTYHLPSSFFITGITVDNDDFSGNNRAGFGNIRAWISDVNGNIIASSTNTLWGQFGVHNYTFAFDGQLIPQDFKLSLIIDDILQGATSFTVRNLRFLGNDPTPCAPVFNSQLSSQTVMVGESATLTADVSGNGLTYQWYEGIRGDVSHPISNSNSPTYITQASPIFLRSSFWVSVTNQCGTVNSESVRVVTTDKRPLIFVPGMAGSVLVDQEQNRDLWFGVPCFYDRLTLDPNQYHPPIVASDVLRSAQPAGFTLQIIYETLIQRLVDASPSGGGYRENGNKTLFLLPYDWRKSNGLSADQLGAEIQFVRNQFPGMDVDILAHSMGGLVTQRYILEHTDDHHINKVITVGTPWLGAPKAINALETGQFLETHNLYFCTSDMKALAEHFSGMHELLPSSTYFGQSVISPFEEAGWNIDKDNNNYEPYDYENLVSMLDNQFPSHPGSNNFSFHTLRQDDGRCAPTNISYYHLYGWQKNWRTIGKVVAKRGAVRCALTPLLHCDFFNYFEPKMTAGDGTVPVVSATRRGRGQSLNEPKHQLIPFFATTSEDDESVGHVELCSNPAVFEQVKSILEGPGLMSSGAQENDQVQETAEAAYYLQVIGNPSITIADSLGNTSTLTNSSLGSEIPGVTSYLMADKAFMLVLAAGNTYTITLETGDEPLMISLTLGTEDDTTQAIRYQDLSLPAGVTAMIKMTPQGVEDLRYDANSDGTFETTVTPTVSVSGDAAQDTTPPTVAVSETRQQATTQVTITTTDADSGVRAVFYSLDGSNFQPYTDSLSLDACQTPVVYVFADDNLANRSGLVTYYLSHRISGQLTDVNSNGLSGAIVTTSNGQSVTTDNNGHYVFADVPGGVSYMVQPSLPGYIFSPASFNINNLSCDQTANFTGFRQLASRALADFDGDGKTDISVWQSDTGGKWNIINSADNSVRLQFWGQSSLGDIAVPGDYDGDGRTEIAIYRPSEGNWYILKSSDGTGLLQNWGGTGDRPVPADYDGDGRTDIAVYRPSEGNWYVLQSSGGSSVQGWGDPTDKLVPGDYDGDGRADVAIYRPSEGNWYVSKSTGGSIQQNWGISEDRPVQGDYDGDGTTDFAVFRPSEGNWYIKKSSGGATIRNWGDSSDKPIPGDYDGDGKTDIAVWRPSEGTWYLILSATNMGAQRYLGGYSTDTPIPFAYLPQ